MIRTKGNVDFGVCVSVRYLIDVLVSLDEIDGEFSERCARWVSETRGDPPLQNGHIRQHLHRTQGSKVKVGCGFTPDTRD